MKQARQDGTGWDDRGPFRLRFASARDNSGFPVAVLGSKMIAERFSTKPGQPDGGMTYVMSRSLPRRKLRSYLDLLVASDIADPLREARVKDRAHELIDAGFSGRRARQRARWEVK